MLFLYSTLYSTRLNIRKKIVKDLNFKSVTMTVIVIYLKLSSEVQVLLTVQQ